MIDNHKELVATLNKILPTYYEMALNSKATIPCISYIELNNFTRLNGDTLGYSTIVYQIKVWSRDIKELQTYSKKIDNSLRALGFKRTSSGELYDNQSTMMQKIMTYECLALETY